MLSLIIGASSPDCGDNYLELSGFVGVFHFQSTHRVLEEESNTAEVGVRPDAGDFLVPELFDRDAVIRQDGPCYFCRENAYLG